MDFSDPVAAENLIKSQDQINLQLNGLNCATCVVKLQNALQSVDQVEFVQINLAEQTTLIKGNRILNNYSMLFIKLVIVLKL